MEGGLVLFNTSVRVLFDASASHSFISSSYASSLGLKTKKLDSPISSRTQLGSIMVLTCYCIVIISLPRFSHGERLRRHGYGSLKPYPWIGFAIQILSRDRLSC